MTDGVAERLSIDGGCTSVTTTSNAHVAAEAAELAFTVVVPIGKNEPERGVVDTTPQLPLSVGAGKVTNAPGWFGSVEANTVGGQLSVHGCEAQSGAAVKLSDQPPASVPTSPAASSTTKSCQVPFGLTPLNAE